MVIKFILLNGDFKMEIIIIKMIGNKNKIITLWKLFISSIILLTVLQYLTKLRRKLWNSSFSKVERNKEKKNIYTG